MDVPLMVALEFAILLGYDGQLDQNSDMEKELFISAIDQIKERFNIIFSTLFFSLRKYYLEKVSPRKYLDRFSSYIIVLITVQL